MARKTRQITVPMYEGEDFDEIVELRRIVALTESRAAEVQKSGTARAGDDPETEVQAAKDAYDAFVLEASERAEMWVLEPIGNFEYRELLRAHPPRKVKVKQTGDDGVEREVEEIDPEDAYWKVNTETFGAALVSFVDNEDPEIRTVVAPEFSSEGERRKRIKRLSNGELDTLWIKAKQLNEGLVVDPKSGMYSTGTHSSDET